MCKACDRRLPSEREFLFMAVDTREVWPSRNLELTSNWDHQKEGKERRTLTLLFCSNQVSLLTHSGGVGSIRVSGRGEEKESKNILLNFERGEVSLINPTSLQRS